MSAISNWKHVADERPSALEMLGVLLIFVVIGIYAFNPFMNFVDRISRTAHEERVDDMWQRLIDAPPGSIFELADGTLCKTRAESAGQPALYYACLERRFSPERIQQVVALYPVGSKGWQELSPAFE